MVYGLKGQHALVTGGGRGLGLAIAAALCAAGVRVSIIGRDKATLDAAIAAGKAHAAAAVDITDDEALLEAMAELASAAPFDIAIANAGGAETMPFPRTDSAHFRQMLDLNLVATASIFRAALGPMVARGNGRLVAIASTAGHRGYAFASAYSAAKHGVIGLVKSLALEVAKFGVTVNAVSPGYADTDLVAGAVSRIAAKGQIPAGEAKARLALDNPLGRLIAPDEVAASVLHLCTPAARAINGQSILVNGGEF